VLSALMPFRKMDIKSNGFEVETEINVKALKKSGLKIIEVPSFEKKRIYGVGKLRSFPDGWRISRLFCVSDFLK